MTAFLIDNFPQARAEHMSQPRFTDRLDLAAVSTAVGCSRAFTKLALTNWGASSIVDDALLVVSELITNAVEATGATEVHPTWVELDKLNLVGVHLLGLETSIVIEVLDVDPYLPMKPQGEKLDAESGRGLFLVNKVERTCDLPQVLLWPRDTSRSCRNSEGECFLCTHDGCRSTARLAELATIKPLALKPRFFTSRYTLGGDPP